MRGYLVFKIWCVVYTYRTSQWRLVISQRLNSYTWLEATILNCAALETRSVPVFKSSDWFFSNIYTHYWYLKQLQGLNYDTLSSDSQILSGLELSPDIYSHTQLLEQKPNISHNELLTSNQHTPLYSSPKHPHSSK